MKRRKDKRMAAPRSSTTGTATKELHPASIHTEPPPPIILTTHMRLLMPTGLVSVISLPHPLSGLRSPSHARVAQPWSTGIACGLRHPKEEEATASGWFLSTPSHG